MNKQLQQTAKYMTLAGLPVNTAPVDVVPAEAHYIRQKYAQKQFDEYEMSFSKCKHGLEVNYARALTSLSARLHSVLTDAHALGLAYLLPVGFEMHHESLMSTFWTVEEIRRLEHDQYRVTPIETCSPKCFLVVDYRGKIVKSPSYQPSHIADLFASLAGQELFDFDHARRLYFDIPDEDEEEEDEDTKPEVFIFPDLSDEDEVWKELD